MRTDAKNTNEMRITRRTKNSFYAFPRRYPRTFASRGFTVAELLVAMGIFTIVIGLVVGIFVGGFRAQRSLVALMAANDNASLTLEQMMRELRTGTQFCIWDVSTSSCANPASVSGSALQFKNADDTTVTYQLNFSASTIERVVNGRTLAITGNAVRVSHLQFYLLHDGSVGSQWPPRITITLSVSSTAVNLQDIVTQLQTTVSGRNI